MVKTNYTSTEDMNNKLQELIGKTKLNICKNISNYSDNMNIRFNEDPFAKNAKVIYKNLSWSVIINEISTDSATG